MIPKCIEVGTNFDNKDTPESVIERLTKDLSDEEMFTRLIFAESLASQCIDASSVGSAKAKSISQGIAWVLENRVKANKEKQFGVGRGVVTKTSQFRSSTGSCDVAKRVEFLCPEKAGAHWKAAWANAQEALHKTREGKNPMPGTKLYFFAHHFDNSVNCAKWKGKPAGFAIPKNEVASNLPDLPKGDACIQFYKE
ncbi:hypothetical protein D3C72_1327350 [compost metagenome]